MCLVECCDQCDFNMLCQCVGRSQSWFQAITRTHASSSMIVVQYARSCVVYPSSSRTSCATIQKLMRTSGDHRTRPRLNCGKLFHCTSIGFRAMNGNWSSKNGTVVHTPESETTCYYPSWHELTRKLFRFPRRFAQQGILPILENCRKNRRKSTHNRLCLICSRPATYRDMVVWGRD